MFKTRFAKPLVSFHRPLTRFETRLDCSGTVHPLSLARLIPSAGNNKLTKTMRRGVIERNFREVSKKNVLHNHASIRLEQVWNVRYLPTRSTD